MPKKKRKKKVICIEKKSQYLNKIINSYIPCWEPFQAIHFTFGIIGLWSTHSIRQRHKSNETKKNGVTDM